MTELGSQGHGDDWAGVSGLWGMIGPGSEDHGDDWARISGSRG